MSHYFAYYRPQTKFAKVMFLQLSVIHSVHRGVLGQVHPRGQVHTPQAGTPPSLRQVHHSPRQVHPPWAGKPPWAGTHSWAGTPAPQAGTHLPRMVHPPRAGTPPGRYSPCRYPLGQVPPSPREQCMLGDTGNKWAVGILLECILVGYAIDVKYFVMVEILILILLLS